MPTTSPDDIWYASRNDFYSAEAISANEASSVQAALSKRERFDFTWATGLEQQNQTGATQGSRGYRTDTRTEYIFDQGAWRLFTPYAELTFSGTSVPNNTYTRCGSLSFKGSTTTSTNFVSAHDGYIIFAQPGIYSVQSRWDVDSGSITMANNSFTTFTTTSSTNPAIVIAPFVGNISIATLSYHVTTNPGERMYFWCNQNSGSTRSLSGWVRVGRMA